MEFHYDETVELSPEDDELLWELYQEYLETQGDKDEE